MNWGTFCRELITNPEDKRRPPRETQWELSFHGLVPHFTDRRSLGAKTGKSVGDLKQEAESWRVHDVAALAEQEQLAVVIDDFEKSKDNRTLSRRYLIS